MTCIIAPVDHADDVAASVDLIFLQTSHYRNHRIFSPEDLVRLARFDLGGRINGGNASAFSLCMDGVQKGVCVGYPLAWDTAYFGLPMAALQCWADRNAPEKAVAEMIAIAVESVQGRHGSLHFSFHVDAESYSLFNAAAENGFRLMDVKNTYVARRNTGQRARRGLFLGARPFHADDLEAFVGLFEQAGFSSRYTRDEAISPAASRALYAEWARNIANLPDAEREIFVLEHGGGLGAAGAGRYLDFRAAGVRKRILTDGLYAGTPGVTGAYAGIINAVVGASLKTDCSLVELKVSLNNRPANRVLQYLGFDCVAQSYALHKALR